MGNILAGAVLIGIGLVGGDSVFYGEFTVFSVVFDALGAFWLVKGLLSLRQSQG